MCRALQPLAGTGKDNIGIVSGEPPLAGTRTDPPSSLQRLRFPSTKIPRASMIAVFIRGSRRPQPALMTRSAPSADAPGAMSADRQPGDSRSRRQPKPDAASYACLGWSENSAVFRARIDWRAPSIGLPAPPAAPIIIDIALGFAGSRAGVCRSRAGRRPADQNKLSFTNSTSLGFNAWLKSTEIVSTAPLLFVRRIFMPRSVPLSVSPPATESACMTVMPGSSG